MDKELTGYTKVQQMMRHLEHGNAYLTRIEIMHTYVVELDQFLNWAMQHEKPIGFVKMILQKRSEISLIAKCIQGMVQRHAPLEREPYIGRWHEVQDEAAYVIGRVEPMLTYIMQKTGASIQAGK